MGKIIDRTAETNINSQGLKMTIIKYKKNNDINVQFEDGAIVEHRAYYEFKNGKIRNPNYDKFYNKYSCRIGETNINSQGLKMTIIKYDSADNIDVQFEDGTIIKHKAYKTFKSGYLNNPNYNKYSCRIGETNINNQGLKMTIIKYDSATDIDVQFEDGTIVEHKAYGNFKNGEIKNPNYDKFYNKYSCRIGETNINNQGLKMTIIAYRRYTDIDVQFEDGTIVDHKAYNNFKDGSLANYNKRNKYSCRIGETNINSQGLKMTIIKNISRTNINVQFEDGTIIEHRKYYEFKDGKIRNPNYNKRNKYSCRIGETNINSQGLKMTIIKYDSATDIDVQFEDGTIVDHRKYYEFKNGKINNPNCRIGETNINGKGLKMTIIKYNNSTDIDVQFEDGAIVEHRIYNNFKNGEIKHLFPYKLPDSDIILEDVSYIHKSQVNYLYKCNKCGLEDIDTLENINNHKCK